MQVVGHIVALSSWTGFVLTPYGEERRIGGDGEHLRLLLQVGYGVVLGFRGQQRLLAEAPANKRGLIAGQIILAQDGHCVIAVIAFVIRRCCTGRVLVAVVGNALLQVVSNAV